jgi:hypothetical protein
MQPMSMNGISWLLAAATAVWFGLLAVKAGKSWPLWALAGGFFGLISSTCIFGLGQATAIPFSDRARTVLHVEWTLAAVAVILVVGGFFTWSLSRKKKSRGVASVNEQAAPVEKKQLAKNAP